MHKAGSVVSPWNRLMAVSSYIRNFLLILALVGVLALGVNSCAAPEETTTDATTTTSSSDSTYNDSTSTDDTSTDELSTTIS